MSPAGEQPRLSALILSIASLAETVCMCVWVGVGKRVRKEQCWCCHSVAIMLKAAHVDADRVKEEPLLIFSLWNEPEKKKHAGWSLIFCCHWSPLCGDMKTDTVISIRRPYQEFSKEISSGNSLFFGVMVLFFLMQSSWDRRGYKVKWTH